MWQLGEHDLVDEAEGARHLRWVSRSGGRWLMAGSVRWREDRQAWELRVHLGGGRQKSVTFRGSKRAALAEVARLSTEVADGHHQAPAGTVEALMARWLEHHELNLERSTLAVYKDCIRLHVLDPDVGIGRLDVGRLTAEDLDLFYARLRRRKNLAPATVAKVHTVVRAALQQAVRWRWIRANPAAEAAPAAARRRQTVPPSPQQVKAAAATVADPATAAFFRLAVATGARRGELCALQWADVDGDELTIRRALARCSPADDVQQIRRGWYVKDTKTHHVRRLRLDAGTVAVLDEHRARFAGFLTGAGHAWRPDAWVFTDDPFGVRPWRPDSTSRRWRHARGDLDAHLHDVRHAHVTELVDAGIPMGVVSLRIGHARESTTSDLYNHARPARDGDAADAIGRALDG